MIVNSYYFLNEFEIMFNTIAIINCIMLESLSINTEPFI